MRIGFIGAGNMAQALIGGAIANNTLIGKYPKLSIQVSDVNEQILAKTVAKYPQVSTCHSNIDLVQAVDAVVLAVKPQQISSVLHDVKSHANGKLFISIAAGITLNYLEQYLPQARLVRVMPNTPCALGAGMTAACFADNCSVEDKAFVESIFSATGRYIEVSEELMNPVTALSGSGPAFIYLVIQAMMQEGISQGLSRQQARLSAAQTVLGAAKIVLAREDETIADLIAAVRSPGGTTEAGLKVLSEAGWNDIFKDALRAAAKRAEELAR